MVSDATDRASVAVVHAVADTTGEGPTEIPPLDSAVDADALDALFDGEDGDHVTVRFRFRGYGVVVHGAHEVEIRK